MKYVWGPGIYDLHVTKSWYDWKRSRTSDRRPIVALSYANEKYTKIQIPKSPFTVEYGFYKVSLQREKSRRIGLCV